jgi:hypothetical protein
LNVAPCNFFCKPHICLSTKVHAEWCLAPMTQPSPDLPLLFSEKLPMVPHLITALTGPINELEQRVLDPCPPSVGPTGMDGAHAPFYCSVDVRKRGASSSRWWIPTTSWTAEQPDARNAAPEVQADG